MSATTPTAVTPSTHLVPVQGWTAGRARRARMFAVLLALTAVVAVWSAFQPWFGYASAGAVTCQRPDVVSTTTVLTPDTNTAVDGIYASSCVSGRDIALQTSDANVSPDVQLALSRLDSVNTTTSPAVLFGLPRPVPLLVLAVAVGVLGLLSRNGVLGFLGILGFYYVHKDLGSFTSAMSSGEGGALNQTLPGFDLFGWSLVLGWGLLGVSTLFVARHNSGARAVAKREALAAGQTPPPTMLDSVLMFAGGKIGVAMEAAQRERGNAMSPE